VHLEEKHTGSEDSRFDCCNFHSSKATFLKFATSQVGVVAMKTILKLF
jgi:hypothetical protein